jgi:hypothetical protein
VQSDRLELVINDLSQSGERSLRTGNPSGYWV